MNPSERIDTQIAELADWRGQMIARLRKLIREADPDITEEWKWDTAVWSHRGLVCAVGAFKQTVKMNFFQGALLEDPQKLFNAGLDAKKTRAIDFREGDAVDESALKELIRAAVAHNVRKNRMIPQESDLPSDLAAPAQRALVEAGYLRLEQLTKVSETELKQLHGIGPNAIKTLRRALEARGLSFAGGKTRKERG